MSEKRASLAAILSACIAYGAGMGLTLPLLGLILERQGVTGSVNGLNLATAGLASLAITPFVPRWIARMGAASFLCVSLAVTAISLIAIYEAPSLWLWFPVRFVLSAGLNGLFVATEFWINRLADESNRGRYIALYSICLAGSFGFGPALLQVIGTRGFAPFGAGALMLMLAAIPVILARKSAPRLDPEETGSVFAVLKVAPAAFAAAAVFGAIDAGMAGLIPVYAVRMGYNEAHAALAVTAIACGSILFQYPIGWLADRMDRRKVLMICAASGIMGATLAPFAVSSHALFYPLLLVWGGVILGIYSVGLTLLGERFKGASLATANAGFILAYCMGMMVGPAVEGTALDLWNPTGFIAVLGGICAAYLVFLLAKKPAQQGAGPAP